ncbi:MAG: response regulator [Desulfuromonadaceae bacterium]|nr:response regulator [Desulfuromonadaceae bacterium]
MSIKVLVADDSITIQKVIGIIFGGDEYSLTIVDNGKAAVDKAREITPDILLIDALMPGMSGYEVAEAVRSTPSLAGKPILILTGSFEPFDEEKAKKNGADGFIAKPFESQQIITKVKELLELGKSRISSAAAPQSQPHSEVIDIPTPVIDQRQEVPVEAAADIWGAFTQDIEPLTTVAPAVTPPSAAAVEPDVFTIVHEENDAQLIQTAIAADISPQDPASQWFPVEENTFEFEDEAVAESPQTAFAGQTAPTQGASFGGITFEGDAATAFSAAPAPDFNYSTPSSMSFEAPPLVESPPFAEMAVPVPSPTSVTLTEEQLKTALAAASKEVIERIVWEVVPDLAEALISEAIRKIKEGS